MKARTLALDEVHIDLFRSHRLKGKVLEICTAGLADSLDHFLLRRDVGHTYFNSRKDLAVTDWLLIGEKIGNRTALPILIRVCDCV